MLKFNSINEIDFEVFITLTPGRIFSTQKMWNIHEHLIEQFLEYLN